MKRAAGLLLFIFFFVIGCGSRSAILPDSVQIKPPAVNVAKDVANYSGIWEGNWNDRQRLACKIAIEAIEPPRAIAVHAWAESFNT